jgi:hypothetical protein
MRRKDECGQSITPPDMLVFHWTEMNVIEVASKIAFVARRMFRIAPLRRRRLLQLIFCCGHCCRVGYRAEWFW